MATWPMASIPGVAIQASSSRPASAQSGRRATGLCHEAMSAPSARRPWRDPRECGPLACRDAPPFVSISDTPGEPLVVKTAGVRRTREVVRRCGTESLAARSRTARASALGHEAPEHAPATRACIGTRAERSVSTWLPAGTRRSRVRPQCPRDTRCTRPAAAGPAAGRERVESQPHGQRGRIVVRVTSLVRLRDDDRRIAADDHRVSCVAIAAISWTAR